MISTPSTDAGVTPGLAVLWGWTFLHEPVGSFFLAGAALVLGGVWLANR